MPIIHIFFLKIKQNLLIMSNFHVLQSFQKIPLQKQKPIV